MADQNKIAKTLSAEELGEFLDRCWKEKGLTLARVQTLAGEYGIQVSLMGAKSFRDTTFDRYLQRIGKAAELNEQLAQLKQSGGSLGAAAETLIGKELIDTLMEFEQTKSIAEDGGIAALDALSKITKRLSDSERGNTALQARLEQLERQNAERDEKKRELQEKISAAKKSKGGLTKETLATIEEQLAIL